MLLPGGAFLGAQRNEVWVWLSWEHRNRAQPGHLTQGRGGSCFQPSPVFPLPHATHLGREGCPCCLEAEMGLS